MHWFCLELNFFLCFNQNDMEFSSLATNYSFACFHIDFLPMFSFVSRNINFYWINDA